MKKKYDSCLFTVRLKSNLNNRASSLYSHCINRRRVDFDFTCHCQCHDSVHRDCHVLIVYNIVGYISSEIVNGAHFLRMISTRKKWLYVIVTPSTRHNIMHNIVVQQYFFVARRIVAESNARRCVSGKSTGQSNDGNNDYIRFCVRRVTLPVRRL